MIYMKTSFVRDCDQSACSYWSTHNCLAPLKCVRQCTEAVVVIFISFNLFIRSRMEDNLVLPMSKQQAHMSLIYKLKLVMK